MDGDDDEKQNVVECAEFWMVVLVIIGIFFGGVFVYALSTGKTALGVASAVGLVGVFGAGTMLAVGI
jgi:hypothetical protein